MNLDTKWILNDSRNYPIDMSKRWISLFTAYKARVKIVYIEVPYKKLIRQNANRTYVVPEVILDKMLRKLEIPTVREAHDVLFEVNEA